MGAHLDYFHVFAIVHCAAANIGLEIPFTYADFFTIEYISKSRRAVLYGRVFCSSQALSILISTVLHYPTLQPTVKETTFLYTALPTGVVILVLNVGQTH